jgi:hypothetical protein
MNWLLSVSGAGGRGAYGEYHILTPVTIKRLCTFPIYGTYAFRQRNRAPVPRKIACSKYYPLATGKPRGAARRTVHMNCFASAEIKLAESD